jgi:hypothetical protein
LQVGVAQATQEALVEVLVDTAQVLAHQAVEHRLNLL